MTFPVLNIVPGSFPRIVGILYFYENEKEQKEETWMNRMGIKCKEDHGSHSDERSVRMHMHTVFIR